MAINYERVNWDTTSYVNPHNMNQMDEGIEAACNAADENSSAITAINSTLESIFRDNIFVATQQINMSELAWSNAKNSKYARVNLNVPSGAVLLDVGIDDFTSGDINVSIFNVMKKANDSIFIFNDTALTTGWVKINYTYAK